MRRAKHNLSNYRITAGNFGQLYPFSATEVLPGDSMRVQASALIRVQPLMTPLMHPVNISIAHFFVPNRIIWSGWENFITGKTAGNVPTFDPLTTTDTVTDYMGVAPNSGPINALPLYAFNKIFNEFYRDQDLLAERAETSNIIPNIAWEKDYFTTARPEPQAGSAVTIPMSGFGRIQVTDPAMTSGAVDLRVDTESPGNFFAQRDTPGVVTDQMQVSLAQGNINIEDWRRSMALQRYQEHRNKFGSRYKDYLAFLGVRSPDGRLDRPEYLGGGRQTISFSEVLQSIETTEVPLGTQGGHGIASIRTKPWRKMFLEHGYMISLMHIRPKAIYATSVDRTYLRQTKDDYWQKENEMLGDQPVMGKELYAPSVSGTFGYSPRHDDYRTQRSLVTGPMREAAYNTWHMARELNADPTLNANFVYELPTKRVFRSSNDPQFYGMVQNRISARRLVAKHARN